MYMRDVVLHVYVNLHGCLRVCMCVYVCDCVCCEHYLYVYIEHGHKFVLVLYRFSKKFPDTIMFVLLHFHYVCYELCVQHYRR